MDSVYIRMDSVYLRIDDPVDAIAVHGGGGIIGILAVPIFMEVPDSLLPPSLSTTL